MVKGFLAKLREKTEINDDEEELIAHNLDRLFDLQKYPFTALEIALSVDEEQVADIFVRIIGRTRFGVAEHRLQKAIGRWFFLASLTGRYTSSPAIMDGDPLCNSRQRAARSTARAS